MDVVICLPYFNAIIAIINQYYILGIIFILQTQIGKMYIDNKDSLIIKGIYVVYIILTVPSYIILSMATDYYKSYLEALYTCYILYITSRLLERFNYTREASITYYLVHYIGNIATFIMLTKLPKIRVEYYLESTGERIV
jgi:hypothetical protein